MTWILSYRRRRAHATCRTAGCARRGCETLPELGRCPRCGGALARGTVVGGAR